ncbi:MAG: hypothetical protein AAB691_00765 [Patescibacteria group bacterium]
MPKKKVLVSPLTDEQREMISLSFLFTHTPGPKAPEKPKQIGLTAQQREMISLSFLFTSNPKT